MNNAAEDKYKYFSGEAKRSAIEIDGNVQLRKLREETNQRLEAFGNQLSDEFAIYIAEQIDETLNGSVKPGVKTRFKKKKVEVSKKALAVGACIFMVVGGYGTTKAIDIAKNVSTKMEQQKIIQSEMEDFQETNYKYNIHFNNVTDSETNEVSTVHWHDFTDMLMNAKQASENPNVTLYMLYNSLDEYCRKTQMESVFGSFNRIYGTDYKDLTDFLLKNNFANESEWKTYVANTLLEEKEAMQNGYSNLGR